MTMPGGLYSGRKDNGMLKKFFAIVINACLVLNTAVFAQITQTDNVYKEDFEGYSDSSEIMADKTIFSQYTKLSPELAELDNSQCLMLSSESGKDNILVTNSGLFCNDINIISYKLAASDAPKVNWGAGAAVLFRYTNAGGKVVNEPIYDFAYGLLRHKINGKEAAIINPYKAMTALNASVITEKAQRDGKYYFDVTYKINSGSFKLSYETVENGIMCIAFKSASSSNLYIDDIEITGNNFVHASLKESGRTDVSVMPEMTITFDDDIDETTLSESSITINSLPVEGPEKINDNCYMFRPAAPLDRQTKYTVKLSGVKDIRGNDIVENEFSFTTKNTAVIIKENNAINTSRSEAETIIKMTTEYKDNSMTSIQKEVCELQAGQSIEFEGDNKIIMTEDYRPIDTTVYAENTGVKNDDFTVLFDEAAQLISVSGKTEWGKSEELLAVSVFANGDTPDYFNMIKTAEDGYFSFIIKPNTISGVYSVNVKSLSEAFEKDVNVRLSGDAERFLEIVNSASDPGEIVKALEDYSVFLSVDFEPYKDADKSFVAEGLIETKKEKGKYAYVEETVEDIKAFSAIYQMKTGQSPEVVFDKYRAFFTSETDKACGEWDLLTDSQKNETLMYTFERNLTTVNSFKDELYLQTLLTRIAYANKYIDVKNIIEKYDDLLSVSLTLYNEKKQPASVAKGLYGTRRTHSEFSAEFARLVDEAGRQPSSSGASGGGGGGGRSGGGTPSSIAAPVKNAAAGLEQVKPSEPENAGFSDIEDAMWAKEAIDKLCERNILSGYENNTFKPNKTITREEFITVIMKYLGVDKTAECSFNDVPGDAWYYIYVADAYKKGIINGIGENMFGAGLNITREDAAVIISNIIGNGNFGSKSVTFEDETEIADYAKQAVNKLAGMGIINGVQDGRFEPKGFLTRAQAAKIIWETAKLKDNAEG